MLMSSVDLPFLRIGAAARAGGAGVRVGVVLEVFPFVGDATSDVVAPFPATAEKNRRGLKFIAPSIRVGTEASSACAATIFYQKSSLPPPEVLSFSSPTCWKALRKPSSYHRWQAR